jgi:hypothetical protein
MDPELFKKRLEEFAELKQAKVPRAAGRAEATQEPEIIERGGKSFAIHLKDNPTLNWEIKKLKPHIAVCESCHDVATDRRIEHKLNETPYKHWRSRCTACEMYKHPVTGKFCLTGNEFRTHLCTAEASKSLLRPVFKKPAK